MMNINDSNHSTDAATFQHEQCEVDGPPCEVISAFIKQRRNLKTGGHERKYMFDVTLPFTDVEGLRFCTTSKCQFDYISYEPTLDHLFLDDASIEGFERYVDVMFNENDKLEDWSYFKILNKLSSDEFREFYSTIKEGRYNRSSASEDFLVPISLIPIAEFMLLEECSQMYTVKSINQCLDKTRLRIKLNTYFRSLLSLLKCSEEDIVEVLYRKGILPCRNFQLVSTQKEVMIAMKRYRSSGLCGRLEKLFKLFESTLGTMKPKYGFQNMNLSQALGALFTLHPLYCQYQRSLQVQTKFIDDGKGCFENSASSRKRRLTSATTQTQENSIFAQAMLSCLPELYLPPGKKFLIMNIDKDFIPSGVVGSFGETTQQVCVDQQLV